MSIELKRFMTAGEQDKVESVLSRVSGRYKRREDGGYFDRGDPCELSLYMTMDEEGEVGAILQKAVDRMPEPGVGGSGEHYLLQMCRCRQYQGSGNSRGDSGIECSRYLGNGCCKGRRYIYDDDLPFI